jgi:hypothetical protein
VIQISGAISGPAYFAISQQLWANMPAFGFHFVVADSLLIGLGYLLVHCCCFFFFFFFFFTSSWKRGAGSRFYFPK